MTSIQWKMTAGTVLLSLCSMAALAQTADPQTEPRTDTGNGVAQGRPGGQWRGERGPEHELRMLTHMLSLTPEQQTGVKAVLDQRESQVRALRTKAAAEDPAAETAETRQARFAQMSQIRDESDTKIAALLDENQKKTFTSWVAQRKAAMARRQAQFGDHAPPEGGPGGPPPPEPPQ